MRLERQNAYPSAKVDVFGAIDWFFPQGLDHHEMFAGVPVAEKVMAKVARQLAGWACCRTSPRPARPPAQDAATRVAVVGRRRGGARRRRRSWRAAGVPFLLLERDARLGGRLADGAPGDDDPVPGPIAVSPTGSSCAPASR